MDGSRHSVGKAGEDAAAAYLESLGHEILARGWRNGHLEVDIISETEKYLHFVEVKTRFCPEVTPASAVNRAKMLNMWMQPGDVTDVPRADVSRQNLLSTDYFLENAAFLRLKNLTITYDLPQSWIKKTKILGGVRVFATGKNLFTVTDFTGVDPEVDSNVAMGNYPNSRQYTFGLEVKF